MFKVSIETDARYRYDQTERRFVEVCPACKLDRRHDETRCPCGREFTRLKRGFFTVSWKPAEIQVKFPQRCPHCLGASESKMSISSQQHTGIGRVGIGGLGAKTTTLFHEVPVCRKKHHPLLLGVLQLVAAFFLVTALVIALFNFLDRLVVASAAMVVAAGCGICMVLLRRAKTWIRFSRFDHRSHTFKARRREYAQELAELNGGRIA